MGDIADMILDGILDAETGEYIGDINEDMYGAEAPGFPVTHNKKRKQSATTRCPLCNKKVKKAGLNRHTEVVHG